MKSIFVGNLAWDVTSENLRELGEKFGRVLSADVKRFQDTNRSKGWGVIEFDDSNAAERAIRELVDIEYRGRNLYVRFDRKNNVNDEIIKSSGSESQNKFSVYVGNLPWHLTDSYLLDLFSPFHPVGCEIIRNMMGRSRGFAIVSFSSEEHANSAIVEINHTVLDGRKLQCRLDKVNKTEEPQVKLSKSLYIGNLSADVDDTKLTSFFAGIGKIKSAKVRLSDKGESRGWGTVVFYSKDAAHDAMIKVKQNFASLELPYEVRFDRRS